MTTEAPLWTPSAERVAASRMTAFAREAECRFGRVFPDFAALHAWSVDFPDEFWPAIWSFVDLIGENDRPGDVVLDRELAPGARWFPGARLNFAENLLRGESDREALIFWNEEGRQSSWRLGQVRAATAAVAESLAADGVVAGDRVAGYLPNLPEAVIAMLAAASIGAVWTSCSPDFGLEGTLDRFGQIGPKILFAARGYRYGGKRYDSLARIADLGKTLPSLRRIVVIEYPELAPSSSTPAFVDAEGRSISMSWGDYARPAAHSPKFARLPFDHPLYVLYSSGTTGKPKCIIHGAGGTLLQHRKEHALHVDLGKDDRFVYFTTLGWMMWNWLVSALASESVVILYDGSPLAREGRVLFDLAEQEGVTVLGTSAKHLALVEKSGLKPKATHDLSPLRTILSTGSPLLPESFDYVYREIKADVCLASISGGTDIVACFVAGNPWSSVRRGEIQGPGLGMDTRVFDEEGRSITGQPGELVCAKAFPSTPLGFWNDPEKQAFRAAYFERFPGVWTHGDFAETTPSGGWIIRGRSDTVLNPGGVRIGTAEIYRQVDSFSEIVESVVVGQSWQGDTRIVLFVRLAEGLSLSEDLIARLKGRLREQASPRHVPAKILAVQDIPRTRSGKISEIAVRETIHGRPTRNAHALANPEALAEFRDLRELSR